MNEKKSFYVIGMSCAGCAANIQQALSERKGVIEARVNFAASDVIVEYNPTLVSDKDLQKTVQEAGYDLLLENETEPEQAEILQREAYDKLHRKTIGDRDVFYAYALWQLDHAGIYLTGPTGIRKGFFH